MFERELLIREYSNSKISSASYIRICMLGLIYGFWGQATLSA
jgi:hypothetical protein